MARRLLAHELPVFQALEVSLAALLECMRRRSAGELDRVGPAADELAGAVRDVAAAARAAGCEQDIYAWEPPPTVPGAASVAGQLLQMGSGASGPWVAILCRQLLGSPARWDAVRDHVARFAKELLDTKRPPAPAMAAWCDSRDRAPGEDAIGLDDEDVRILEALQKRAPLLLTQRQIEGHSGVSRKTISARLPRLLAAGLVRQPTGPKKGYTITGKGKALVDGAGGAKVTP